MGGTSAHPPRRSIANSACRSTTSRDQPAFPPRRLDWRSHVCLARADRCLGSSRGYRLFRDFLARPFTASANATAIIENNPVDVSDPRSRTCGDRSFLDNCRALDGDAARRGRGRQRQAACGCRQSRAQFWRSNQADYRCIELGTPRLGTLLSARYRRDRTT